MALTNFGMGNGIIPLDKTIICDIFTSLLVQMLSGPKGAEAKAVRFKFNFSSH